MESQRHQFFMIIIKGISLFIVQKGPITYTWMFKSLFFNLNGTQSINFRSDVFIWLEQMLWSSQLCANDQEDSAALMCQERRTNCIFTSWLPVYPRWACSISNAKTFLCIWINVANFNTYHIQMSLFFCNSLFTHKHMSL